MNDRIKELAIQAGLACESGYGLYPLNNDLNNLERFAELIRADERDKCAQDYLQDCADAVEAARLEEREQISHTYLKLTLEAVIREREACAKLCESKMIDEYATGKVDHNEQAWTDWCAAAIRQRGEQP